MSLHLAQRCEGRRDQRRVAAKVTGEQVSAHQGWLPWSSQFSSLETLGGLSSYFMKDGKDILLQRPAPFLIVILCLNHIRVSLGTVQALMSIFCSIPSMSNPSTPASQPHQNSTSNPLPPSSSPNLFSHFGILSISTFPVNTEFSCSFIHPFNALYQCATATLQVIIPESV